MAAASCAIVSRLNGEIVKALQDAGLRARMEEQGADPCSSTPAGYGAYMKSEFERWTKVVKTGGLKVE